MYSLIMQIPKPRMVGKVRELHRSDTVIDGQSRPQILFDGMGGSLVGLVKANPFTHFQEYS